jgi:membrane fusion protein (multidrug efflux system)
MDRKQYFKWIFMICLVAGLGSCNLDMPVEENTSFKTMKVEKQDIEVPIKFSAKMKGQTDVTITPQVSGQLMKICVTEGQQVKKGQTLFIIDSRNAQLELQSAQANLQAAIASENSAKLEYESNKNLYEKKIVSKYMLDNAENTYKQAQASVAQARSTVNSAKVNLGFCTITAPVAGLIGEISVRTGDQVSPGTQLTMVSGNLQMDAEFSVPESLIEETVSAGTKASDREKILSSLPEVTFLMKNGTEYTHKGRVSSLTGMVNATTGTISCKATFPNPDGQLFSGIQGTVVMPYAVTDVIVIPQTAVVKLQSKQQVYKVKADSTATAVEVKTEDIGNGQDFIVTSGLNVGDEIITIGSNNVQEGQKVLFPESRDKN